MNADLLFKHFARLSDTSEAISRLRQFILDLAVRGKLVEQDSSDEPAIKLLKRLQTERLRQIKNGKVRNQNSVEASVEDDWPFKIPASWAWCRLYEIGAIVGGGTPPSGDPSNFAPAGTGFRWLTPADLGGHSDLYISHGARDLTAQGLHSSSATMMPKGSVLFTSRAPIGYTAISANDISTNQGFKSVVPFIPETNIYIALYLRAFRRWIDSQASGTTFREVSGKIVARLPFPLPPLAEQRRIVTKVDELMAFCDRLEDAGAQREAKRDRLTAATLARLNAPAPEARRFAADAQFALGNLAAITKRSDQLKQLRQTILSLAIRGRLAPQDPTDKPASQLISEIASTRKRLYEAKKIPKPSQLPAIPESDHPFRLPCGWCWSRLGDICYQVSDGPHFSPQYVRKEEGVPFLSTRNVRLEGFDLSTVKYVSQSDHELFCKRIRPEKGDIIYTKGGTTGIAKVNDLDFDFSVWVHLAVLRIEKEKLLPRYVELALNSPHCYEQSQLYTRGISNFDLGLTRMIKITLPLPPLPEQRRIVAKVDELTALCDRLEAHLSTTENEGRRLLEAVLHDALKDNQEQIVQPEAVHG